MADFIIKKWKCDCCGIILDERPLLKFPRAFLKFEINEEWHTQCHSWKDICQDCNREIYEIIEGLRRKKR